MNKVKNSPEIVDRFVIHTFDNNKIAVVDRVNCKALYFNKSTIKLKEYINNVALIYNNKCFKTKTKHFTDFQNV